MVDAYALSLAALLLTAGSLADMFGRRLLFAIGLAVFTVGSLLCALATDPMFLVAARAGQGIGGAIMFATSLALLAQAFHGRERGTAFAVWGAVTGVAVAVGPVLGGVITTGWSWRGIFFVNIPVGVIAIVVTLWRVAESRDPGRRTVDVPGFALFTAALIALVYGLIRAGEQGWGDPGVAACLAGAAVLLAAFVAVEQLRLRAHVRPDAVPGADVRRRLGGRVRRQRLRVRDGALPRAVPAGPARVQRAADRAAPADHVGGHAAGRDRLGPAEQPGPGAAADRRWAWPCPAPGCC